MKIKELKKGSTVKLKRLTKESRETRPPNRFSEVSLAKKLSDLGIGRPSTLSSIISTIQDRGYVVRKGSQLYPTPLGFAIANLLSDKLTEFVSYDYTASMEQSLDEIAEGSKTRIDFLSDFWKGADGFDSRIEKLLNGELTFDELKEYSKIDLHNGYVVRFSKFGVFLEDPNGEPNEKGYLPSAKLDDNVDLWDYKDSDLCKETLEKSANTVGPRELGVLSSGLHDGWTVYLKDGKFGYYLQGVHPDQIKAEEAGKKPSSKTPKPVNHKLSEDLNVDEVTLEDVEALFSEVKLPRHLSDKIFVGIGKRGPWLGFKASAKSRRATFIGLDEQYDPRTIDLAKAEELLEAHKAKKKKS